MTCAAHTTWGYDGTAHSYMRVASAVGKSSREARIAEAILSMAKAEASSLGGAQLRRISVNVGADCDIDIVVLENALSVIRHGSDLEDMVVHLSRCPRVYRCRSCGCECSSEVSLLQCVTCSSTECELVSGDELELAFIEVALA